MSLDISMGTFVHTSMDTSIDVSFDISTTRNMRVMFLAHATRQMSFMFVVAQ